MLTANESLLVLQAFLILISMTALPMAALTVERRAALERERAARAEADAASRAKDEFLAILSHELRNPLAAISTAAAVLDTGQQAQESVARLVTSIRRQTQHLARLIDDLLDIGRMTANKLILRKEPVELAGAVRRCVDGLVAARGLQAGRVELALEAVWIEADPVRVTQIVENLIGNALKHTPAGKRIRVTVRDIGAVAELRVEDEGFGIRPELLPNVFEPFTQGQQGLDRSAGGLGIGPHARSPPRRSCTAALSKRTAAASIAAAPSFFGFRVAARRSARCRGTASRSAAPDPPRRLLVIEDNVDARQTLRALLETLGHEVHEAADGEAGIAAALELRPDLVFVDIGLPRLDGYEVARRLRAAKPAMRLVALTGYGRDDDVQRARDAGFDEHLLKPASSSKSGRPSTPRRSSARRRARRAGTPRRSRIGRACRAAPTYVRAAIRRMPNRRARMRARASRARCAPWRFRPQRASAATQNPPTIGQTPPLWYCHAEFCRCRAMYGRQSALCLRIGRTTARTGYGSCTRLASKASSVRRAALRSRRRRAWRARCRTRRLRRRRTKS